MTHLRLFVLILLAVLLPVRGVVAATMLCPAAQGAGGAALADERGHGHDDMHAAHAMHAGHPPAHHQAGGESSSSEHPTACHFCASGCCMATIVGAVPPLGPPGLTFTLAFPTLSAPAPAFESGGPDRPPRTP